MKEEEMLQEKYIEMKMIEEQMKEMQQNAAALEQQLFELITVKQSLDDFKKTNKGNEILAPISPGIFAKAELKDSKEFLVNVGANIVVKKDIESTKKLIGSQVEEVRGLHSKVMVQMQRIALHASSVEEELKKLASKLQ